MDRSTTTLRRFTWLASMAVVLAGAAPLPVVGAEPYPSRPVRIIVPYSAGGGTDVVTRTLAQRLGDALGQPFVVENRPGGRGGDHCGERPSAPGEGCSPSGALSLERQG